MSKLTSTTDLIRQTGTEVNIVSAGGTGTFDITGTYPGVTEVEAGSYLFMDTEYEKVGVPFIPSIKVLATVISTPTPQRAIIDAGMKSISTDNGLPKMLAKNGIVLKALHEEHGILEIDPSAASLNIGDQVALLPSHVCTTVNLHDKYYVMRRESLEEIWPIKGRGKFQ
jgi:D-serine deaminase-like pyridoxal phosphate-dependent protein